MLFNILVYSSLVLCLLGLTYRFFIWFKLRIGPESGKFSPGERFGAAFKCFTRTLFSSRGPLFLKALFADVLLQIGTLKEDSLRWAMHGLIFFGFMLLLLFHALGDHISPAVFAGYESTLNPYLELRNILGLMVLAGLVIAIVRRRKLPVLKIVTGKKDWMAIVVLAAIMITGFMLEGLKIVSEPVFNDMVENYSFISDDEEALALKSVWAKDYGVVFKEKDLPMDEETMELGRELNEDSCVSCHAKPQSAFVSYAFSSIIRPAAGWLNDIRADRLLYWVHVLLCLVALAMLPFTKFFHIVSTPIKLLTRVLDPEEMAKPVNVATRRAMELDSCTRCGLCSLHCSVNVHAQCLGNKDILPTEKLAASLHFASGRRFHNGDMEAFREGSFVCTSCNRCTELCPVGIDLQDLWLALKQDLKSSGFEDPMVWARKTRSSELEKIFKANGQPLKFGEKRLLTQVGLSAQSSMFSSCFECQTCTNVCPVVALYEKPNEALDLLPHQIMHSLGLGMKEMALGAGMIWDCTTCYMCQEYCPQGIQVTDVFYELKNLSYEELRSADPNAAARACQVDGGEKK